MGGREGRRVHTSTFQERSTWLALEIQPSQDKTGLPPDAP